VRVPCAVYTLQGECQIHHFTSSPLHLLTSLDELFAQLQVATAPAEIDTLRNGIWQVWLTTGEQALDKQLEVGMRALAAEDYGRAITCFTALITARPAWAEGWNKRATAYFMRGEYRASLADITDTLRLEPRHFGALGGRAMILRQLGHYRGALHALRRLEKLCPHWPGLQEELRDMRDQLDS